MTLYLSHSTATVGDQVTSISSLGNFLTTSMSAGLGSWVLRSPRVPSAYRTLISANIGALTNIITKSSSSQFTVMSVSSGFDISVEANIDAINTSVAGLACYAGIRYDFYSGYIEIGRYKTPLGQSFGIRSTIPNISLFGDIQTSAQQFYMRFAKSGTKLYIDFDGTQTTLDVATSDGVLQLVSYADVNYTTSTICYIYNGVVTPSVVVGSALADTIVAHDRVLFTVPDLATGTYQVSVAGYDISDSGVLNIESTALRTLPDGFGLNGSLSGDREVR